MGRVPGNAWLQRSCARRSPGAPSASSTSLAGQHAQVHRSRSRRTHRHLRGHQEGRPSPTSMIWTSIAPDLGCSAAERTMQTPTQNAHGFPHMLLILGYVRSSGGGSGCIPSSAICRMGFTAYVLLPESIREFFGIRGVTPDLVLDILSELGGAPPPGAVGARGVVLKVIPMGWSWAPFIAHTLMLDIFERAMGSSGSRRVAD